MSKNQLPAAYMSPEGEPVTDPVYKLAGDCYIDDMYWPEGDTIIFHATPNQSMVPLNAAAQENMTKWLVSLPGAGNARHEDLIQAAMELRPKEGEDVMAFEEYQLAVLKRALAIRAKREGRKFEELDMPVAMPVAKQNVPPMSNTNYTSGG